MPLLPMTKLELGHRGEAWEPGCLRAVAGELLFTFLFVFIGVASTITAGKAAGGAGEAAAVTAAAMAQALVVAVLATAGFHVSGGHLNPAVTLSLAVGGHITLFRSALYVAAQLAGSSLACLLLRCLTGGAATPVHALADGVGPVQGVAAEAVFTFTLLLVICATILDPRRAAPPGTGPLLTGLLVGANTVAGGALTGASMNPARSFGPALATGEWAHHWVYWVGPLAGGPLAVVAYELLFMDVEDAGGAHQPLSQE
uniref:Aquaporin n=1 Tax=Oryza glumipatula TaxID=40148 RepID=A0A0D9Y5N2_9ORYZ